MMILITKTSDQTSQKGTPSLYLLLHSYYFLSPGYLVLPPFFLAIL